MPLPRTGRMKQLNRNIHTVPNSNTALTTTDTYVRLLSVTNITATAATLTIKDTQGTPLYLMKDISIEPGTVVIIPWTDEGIKLYGGLQWSSNTANALQAALNGEYLPSS